MPSDEQPETAVRIPAEMGDRGQVIIPEIVRKHLNLIKGSQIWLTVEKRTPPTYPEGKE